MNAEQISKLSTADLIKLYNEKTGKSIKKFSSRAAGEKQVLALFETTEKKRTGRYDNALTSQLVQSAAAIAAGKVAPKATNKVAPAKAVAKKSEDKVSRAEAISASWKDPEVAAKRAERTHVKAGNRVYRSVREAFQDLRLPLNKHIKFRMELKQVQELTFKHEGRAITFHVVAEE